MATPLLKTGDINPATGQPWTQPEIEYINTIRQQQDAGTYNQQNIDNYLAQQIAQGGPAASGTDNLLNVQGGLDWAKENDAVKQANAEQALKAGEDIGQINGQNTLQSVQYANSILSNPQNAALYEMQRRGYALGPQAGETVSQYLNRSLGDEAKPAASAPVSTPVGETPQPIGTPAGSTSAPPTFFNGVPVVTTGVPKNAVDGTNYKAGLDSIGQGAFKGGSGVDFGLDLGTTNEILNGNYGQNTPGTGDDYVAYTGPDKQTHEVSKSELGQDFKNSGITGSSFQGLNRDQANSLTNMSVNPAFKGVSSDTLKNIAQNPDAFKAWSAATSGPPKMETGGTVSTAYGGVVAGGIPGKEDGAGSGSLKYGGNVPGYYSGGLLADDAMGGLGAAANKYAAQWAVANGKDPSKITRDDYDRAVGNFATTLHNIDSLKKEAMTVGQRLGMTGDNPNADYDKGLLKDFYSKLNPDYAKGADTNKMVQDFKGVSDAISSGRWNDLLGSSGYNTPWARLSAYYSPETLPSIDQTGDSAPASAPTSGSDNPDNTQGWHFGHEDYPFQDLMNQSGESYPFQKALNSEGESYPFENAGKDIIGFFHAQGGVTSFDPQDNSMTIGGAPHWIVDNAGKPIAAIIEDGKPEKVKGHGVEVIPMTEPRHSDYMQRKSEGKVAGLKRGGGVSTDRNAISRNTAQLPDGVSARVKPAVADGRVNNGRNQGRQMPGDFKPGQAHITDQDAASVLPAPRNYNILPVEQLQQMNFPIPHFAVGGNYGFNTPQDAMNFAQQTAGYNAQQRQALSDIASGRVKLPSNGGGSWSTGPVNPNPPPIATAPGQSSLTAPKPTGTPPPLASTPPAIPGQGQGGPTFVGSGGNRTINNTVGGAKFGFDANAPIDIAAHGATRNIPGNPGVSIAQPWKFSARTINNLGKSGQDMLQSQWNASGGSPDELFGRQATSQPGVASIAGSYQ